MDCEDTESEDDFQKFYPVKFISVFPDSSFYLFDVKGLDVHDYGDDTLNEDILLQIVSLRYLNVSCNALISLPKELHQLCNLQVLDVSHNHLKNLPECLGLLKLEKLTISGNTFEVLPSCVTEINSLKVLKANKCSLKCLPDNPIKWKNLVKLSLIDNKLTEIPDNLFQCTPNLQYFNIDGNSIVEIPEAIGLLASLKTLDVSSNPVSCLPASAINLKNLTRIHIKSLNFKVLGNEISGMINLKKFDAHSCNISDIQCNLNSLNNLQELNLALNKLQEVSLNIFPKNLSIMILAFNEIRTLPKDLSCFANLKELNISYNKISKIPDALFKLRNLEILNVLGNEAEVIESRSSSIDNTNASSVHNMQELNLSQNEITSVPSFLSEMTNLVTLSMEGCKLCELPKEMESLRDLHLLNMRHNRLFTIPENTFSFMPCLTKLEISDNELTLLPKSITRLTQLKELIAYGNKIGEFPDGIGHWNNIQILDLSANKISYVPEEMAKLSNLRELRLYNNKIVEISFNFSSMKLLQSLDLGMNKLIKFPNICQNSSLSSLILCENEIAEIPADFFLLENMELFNIAKNQVNNIGENIFTMKNLEILEIAENKGAIKVLDSRNENINCYIKELVLHGNIMETIHPYILKMKNLVQLNASSCDIKNIRGDSFNLKNLSILNLSNNLITAIPDNFFASMVNLTELGLGSNNLSSLPSSLGCLVRLEVLILNRNKLETLPESSKDIVTLREVDLHGNRLKCLPEGFLELKHLVKLDLSKNSLTELALHCKKLKILNVEANKFSSFPDLSEMTSLEYVNFSSNDLIELPPSVFTLPNLKVLDVSRNRIASIDFELIKSTVKLIFKHNLLKWPPLDIQLLGLSGVKTFFRDLKHRKVDVDPKIKLIIIGNSYSGKTTLCRNLSERFRSKTVKIERTRVVESSDIILHKDDKRLKVFICDMAGQDIYDSTHRLFFSHHSPYILSVNLLEYASGNFHDVIGKWLDLLLCYANNSFVIVLVTHVDQVKGKERNRTEQKIQQIKDLMDGYLAMKNNSFEGLQLPFILGYVAINCRDGTHVGFEQIREIILKACFDDGKVPLETKVPYSWNKFANLIYSFESKYVIDMESVHELAQRAQISDVETVLRYLTLSGNVLYFQMGNLANVVFHNPIALIRVLQTMFMHNIDELCGPRSSSNIFRRWIMKKNEKTSELYDKLKDNARLSCLTDTQIDSIFRQMKNGIFPLQFIEVMIQHHVPDSIDFEIIIELMKNFKFCYELKQTEAVDADYHDPIKTLPKLCFPCYFPKHVSAEEINESYPTNKKAKKELHFRFMMVPYCCDLWARLVVVLHQHASFFKHAWTAGLIAVFGPVVVYLKLSKSENENMIISLSLRSASSTEEIAHIAMVFWKIYESLNGVMEMVTGLKHSVEFICPFCLSGSFVLQKSMPENSTCSECQEWVPVGDLLNSSKHNRIATSYSMVDVAFFLHHNHFMQINWKFIAHILGMESEVNDIWTLVNSQYGAPLPSECAYTLILKWCKRNENIDYVRLLTEKLRKIPELKDITECLENEVEKWASER